MVSVIISEGILLIASITVAAGLSAVVMNKVGSFQSVFSSLAEANKEEALTKIKIIYATNSSSAVVNVWVKNTGISPIKNLENTDVYFGKIGSVQRIPYSSESLPTWNYVGMASMLEWQVRDTVQIKITLDNTLQTNVTYMLRIATSNGVSDDYMFSIS